MSVCRCCCLAWTLEGDGCMSGLRGGRVRQGAVMMDEAQSPTQIAICHLHVLPLMPDGSSVLFAPAAVSFGSITAASQSAKLARRHADAHHVLHHDVRICVPHQHARPHQCRLRALSHARGDEKITHIHKKRCGAQVRSPTSPSTRSCFSNLLHSPRRAYTITPRTVWHTPYAHTHTHAVCHFACSSHVHWLAIATHTTTTLA